MKENEHQKNWAAKVLPWSGYVGNKKTTDKSEQAVEDIKCLVLKVQTRLD
ncbi:MAG: hypothetical protein ACRD5H_08475 [Nitrososphaerales archaeon]